MNCKFTVTCCSCNCRTELTAEKWAFVGRFLCPNCRQELPDTSYRFLCDAMNAIAVIPSDLGGFTVAINERELPVQRS